MGEKSSWWKFKILYRVKWAINKAKKMCNLEVDEESCFPNKSFVGTNEFDELIVQMLKDDAPFMVARYGSTEATLLFHSLGVMVGAIKKINPKYFNNLIMLSGFFPNDVGLLEQWTDIMLRTSKQVDVLCYWSTGYQEYLVKKICPPEMKLTELNNLQPFSKQHPWTEALKGKKVLVIHPFSETIAEQYKKREFIWENQNILPEFTLYTLKAVQTIAGQKDDRFGNWFEALEYMYQEGMKFDFDVAIVACGAYGMPLAARFKEAGKKAIHWGGMSQIWFGIKGARWDNKPTVNQFYNEYWTRPGKKETPQDNNKVEGGCYW